MLLSPKKSSLYTTAIKSVSTILLAAGYLVASLVLMMFLEPGINPPGFTGRGAYALVLILVGGFHLSGRWRSTIPFMIFGAVAASLLLPNYIGDRRLQFRLGDHSYSPEIWAATIDWCIFVVSVSLLVRMTALVRWRLIQDVPREHPACRYCCYDLRAAERICPECGTPFDRQDPASILAAHRHWDFRWLGRRVLAMALFAGLPLAAVYIFFYLRSDARAVARVEETGGQLGLQSDLPPCLRWWPPALPTAWIEGLFMHPTLVMWRGSAITDAELICLRPLPRITEVHIDNSPLTGSGFAILVPSPNLAALYMPGSRINDAGLAVIGKLRSLGDLQLDYTDVTDVGLTSLKQLGRLEYLRLDHTAITDVGLLSVADMRKLKYVSVNGTKVTAAGLERFKLLRPDVLVEGP